MDVDHLRLYICAHIDEAVKKDPTFYPYCEDIDKKDKGARRFNDEIEGTPEEWQKRMEKTKCHADEIMFKLSADYLKREIILHLVGCGFDKNVYRPADESLPSDVQPINLLYFSQTLFGIGHYQSIRPRKSNLMDVTNVTDSTVNNSKFESTQIESGPKKRKGSKRKKPNVSPELSSRFTRSQNKTDTSENMTMRSTRSKSQSSLPKKSKVQSETKTKSRSKSSSSNKRARR